MGMDVMLYAEVPEDFDTLALDELEWQFERLAPGFADFGEKKLEFKNYHWLEKPRVEVQTLSRYFSPTYQRGHWPNIRQAIEAMYALFPGCPIHYGSDSSDDADRMTQTRLDECDMAWAVLRAGEN